jgi:hypothetical protein
MFCSRLSSTPSAAAMESASDCVRGGGSAWSSWEDDAEAAAGAESNDAVGGGSSSWCWRLLAPTQEW